MERIVGENCVNFVDNYAFFLLRVRFLSHTVSPVFVRNDLYDPITKGLERVQEVSGVWKEWRPPIGYGGGVYDPFAP